MQLLSNFPSKSNRESIHRLAAHTVVSRHVMSLVRFTVQAPPACCSLFTCSGGSLEIKDLALTQFYPSLVHLPQKGRENQGSKLRVYLD